MIPKIVMSPGNRYGRSFKGLVNYIANDARDPETGQMSHGRVAHTLVRNLPSDKPSIAWKVMAATAMNREQLKAAAGVKKGGRGDKGEVIHLVLSWDRSERGSLTLNQISEAADETLKYLGLVEHQVYGVVHDEPEKPPHIHLAINRVHPETGKIANDWRSQRKLSKWALEYEKKRGEVLVPKREANWRAREQGLELPRQPSKNRADYEVEKVVGPSEELNRRLEQQRSDREQLTRRQAELRRRGEAYRATAWRLHRKRLAAVHEAAERRKAETKRRIERSFLREHQRIMEAQREEGTAFEQNEQTLAGRIRNRLAYTDWNRVEDSGSRLGFTRFFNAWSEPGFPRSQIEQQQQEEIDRLHETRRRLHDRRERRIDGRTRQECQQLRREQGERLRRFEELQRQNVERFASERGRLDKARRQLIMLGRKANRARNQLKVHDRPVNQSDLVFTDEPEKVTAEEGGQSSSERLPARRDNDSLSDFESDDRRKRIRRPRKPRANGSDRSQQEPNRDTGDEWNASRSTPGHSEERER